MKTHINSRSVGLFLAFLLTTSLLYAGGTQEEPESEANRASGDPGERVEMGSSSDNQGESVSVPIWDILVQSNDDAEFLDQVRERLESGMLPVGLHLEAGLPPFVLYGINLGADVESVALHRFEDPDTTPQDLTAFIADGWLPMAISTPGGDLIALMVRSNIEVRDWGMAFVPFDQQSIQAEINRRSDEGFSLWAISNWEDQAWLLFIQEGPDAPARSFDVQQFAFEQEAYISGLDSATSAGWYPWGVTTAGETITVLFTQTEEE